MRKFYITLLLLMSAIWCAPWASAANTDPMPLPWTPELGFRMGSVNSDWYEYFVSLSGNSFTKGWSYESDSGDWRFRSMPSKTGSNASPNTDPQDSWLLLPPMEFTAGECYLLTFKASSYEERSKGNGSFNVVLAQERSLEGARAGQEILAKQTLEYWRDNDGKAYTVYFVPENSGVQTIMFHCTSLGGAGKMMLNKVNKNMLVKRTHLSLPSEPTDLSATPDPEGRKQATVTFTAPATTVVGEPVTEMTFIDILLDGTRVHRIDNPVPGQQYSVSIKGTQAVPAKITVMGGNSHGLGNEASITCTIGTILNAPTIADRKKVENNKNIFWKEYVMHAVYDNGTARISWDADPAEGATYTVKRYPGGQVIASGITDTSCTDPSVTSDFPANFQYELITEIDGAISSQGIYSNLIAINNDMPYNLAFSSVESGYETSFEDHDNSQFSVVANSDHLGIGSGDTDGDWAITPSVRLEAGKHYKVNIHSAITSNGRPYHVVVKAGKSNTSKDMDITISEEFLENGIDNRGGTEHTGFFQVEEDGAYFFGINAWVDERCYSGFKIYTFSVTEVDPQLPAAVENLTVKFDAEDPAKAKLQFNAPTKSVAGQDLTAITAIKVYKDGEELANIDAPEPGSAQSLDIEAKLGEQIVYTLTPFMGQEEGVTVEFPVCILTAPYHNDFTYSKDLVGYTVIDPAKDGFSWSLYNGHARCYSFDKNMDDWMITPPIHLEGGYFYKVQYTASLEKDDTAGNSTSTVTLCVGEEPTIEAMTHTAVPAYVPRGGYGNAVLLKDYVWIEQTGEYYFGWNAKGNENILVDNFSVSDKINPGVPDKALELTITPDKMGAMKGEISFVSPSVTLKGEPLYGNIDYTVYRDGMAVYTTTTTPNKTVRFTDQGMTEGVHLYTVYPTNTQGLGREAEDVAYFGVNRPYVPENFDMRETDTYGTVLLTWEAPSTDYDGFPINPDLITYDLFTYDPSENKEYAVASGIQGLSYTHKAKEPTALQAPMLYGIRARTSKGGSPGLLGKVIIVGAPYTAPFSESFANSNPKAIFVSQGIEGLCQWGFSYTDNAGVTCMDGDKGMALMESAYLDSESRLMMGKILLPERDPYMSFYIYNITSRGEDINDFEIEIGRPGNWTSVARKTVNEWARGEEGWQKVRLDLSEYAGQLVQISFRARCNKYTFTHFDCLSIGQGGQDDLSISKWEAPRRVNPAEEFDMSVTVKNNGLNDAEIYTVRVLRDNELVAAANGDPLKPGENKTYKFTDSIDKKADTDIFNYTIDVRYSPDSDLSDNRVNDVRISVRPTESLPKPGELTATVSGTSDVTLTWQAPDLATAPVEVTEDTEGFNAWEGMLDVLGDFQSVDQDHAGLIYGRGLETLPISNRAGEGWCIFDTSCAEMQAVNQQQGWEMFSAHSGSKCFATIGIASEETFCDDWLILPELSGEAQTIKLWARTCVPGYYEDLVFCTSSKTDLIRDFEVVEEHFKIPVEWTEYTVDVPEGTRYFALRHVTLGGFFMMADDITYTPAGPERLVMEGYKLYHNGELIASPGKDVTTFAHNGVADGNHDYAVAVKYDRGESADATASVRTTGVACAYADGPAAYGMTGHILVTGADGLDVNIFDASGAHIYMVQGNASIPMQPGVYVVRVGEKPFKIIVK